MAIEYIDENLIARLKKKSNWPETGYRLYCDEKERGFGVKIAANGVISFALNYTTSDGRQRRAKIDYNEATFRAKDARERSAEAQAGDRTERG